MKIAAESLVECVTTSGEEVEGHLVRLGRFEAVFLVSSCFDSMRTSEAVTSLKISSGKQVLYEGRATVRSLVDTQKGLLCEVTLDAKGISLELLPKLESENFESFTKQWIAASRILPEFKVVVADVSILLNNVQMWMNQLELGLQASGSERVAERERDFLQRVSARVITSFNAQHERFEELAYRASAETRAAHQAHAFREWNSFFLSTPFGHRTFYKPLGYAGDYEMMDMIHRNAPEGPSLFAKAMHLLLVSQWPAESVRNRIAHLGELFINETARVVREGRRARILNLGCGPAREVQTFIEKSPLSDHADFTLLDFNHETIAYTGARLEEVRRKAGRRTGLEMKQMSVHQLLRSAVSQNRSGSAGEEYDLIYCAGLFDYLAETTCKALVKLFYHWLKPGGMTAVANMNDSKPFRNFIEYLLDWHLIYRNSRDMWSFAPPELLSQATVIAEPTTVNLFLHVRREA